MLHLARFASRRRACYVVTRNRRNGNHGLLVHTSSSQSYIPYVQLRNDVFTKVSFSSQVVAQDTQATEESREEKLIVPKVNVTGPKRNEKENESSKGKSAVASERSVEEQYSRKTPLEHILLRPGMYVGPVERIPPSQCWVLDPLPSPPLPSLISSIPLHQTPFPPTPICEIFNNRDGKKSKDDSSKNIVGPKMVKKDLPLHPALIKIFDEILVNASDNRHRSSSAKSTTRIDVIIDPGSISANRPPLIVVSNNGKGIPIQIHKKEQMYVPELLFGHLLTGSNFDDEKEKKVTGGRHGYGAKLTNIFSKFFSVETRDSTRGKAYRQIWRDNMKVVEEAQIWDVPKYDFGRGSDADDFTSVSFIPDLEKLSNHYVKDSSITNDDDNVIPSEDYAIMCRRVYDVAGCSGGKVTVTLNGNVVPVSNFRDYANLYRIATFTNSETKSPSLPPLKFQKINARWEVGVGLSQTSSFENVAFVNGMATSRGGTHVNAIVQQITKHLADKIGKIYPELAETVTQGMVRRNLIIFVNSLIENPTFDSQMKEALTCNPNSFGSRYTLSDKFLNELLKEEELSYDNAVRTDGGPGIVEEVVRMARGRQQASLLKEVGGSKRTRRQLLSIPKLDDAHLAGSDHGKQCTLILTEGDSAKALAVAGLEVIGREMYGVFPLRGKFLNVRDASISQLTNNVEVKALCSILGLDFDKDYTTSKERSTLRYGHVMLMTDQDADGSHIKGLIMNFFRHFWPHLLKPVVDCADVDGKPFLSSFITPLLKATRKSGGKKNTKSFFSSAEYNVWRSSLTDDEIQKWNIKYYKGLGTSTQVEAKEYFRDFDKHHRLFRWDSEDDGRLLDMVFEKDRACDRREWISAEYDDSSVVTVDESDDKSVTFENFINKEMIHFSNADNVRSLPSVVDGLKPSQRKVLYACFKRKLKKEIKVAQLTGYCAEHTSYHHGEASLHSTITGMAQDFVGSNNINLLVPSGQFGTRIAGGKDAASPRYIFTYLSPLARLLFPEVDDPLLNHLEDDGQLIEPNFFCPIIPLILVNGSQGIGTGWSTHIPTHNPRDILEYIRAKLDEEELPPIRPWARGFTGTLEVKKDGSGYRSIGKIKKISKNSVLISELPVGKWTNDYKSFLLKMQSKGDIQSFVESHTTSTVSFTVSMKSVQLLRMEKSGLEKVFKLQTNFPLTNMHAFDDKNVIQKYDSPEQIADAYFPIRLDLYHDRKSALQCSKEYSATLVRNKAKFIEEVQNGNIDLLRGKKTKIDTIHLLKELGFAKMSLLESILAHRQDDSGMFNDRRSLEDSNLSDDDVNSQLKEFDYLLNMPLSSLTSEKIDGLQTDASKTEYELEEIRNASPKDLWREDLNKLEPHL